jgi:hypothetical protein
MSRLTAKESERFAVLVELARGEGDPDGPASHRLQHFLDDHIKQIADEHRRVRALLRDLRFYLQGQDIGADVRVNMWENINPALRERIEAAADE